MADADRLDREEMIGVGYVRAMARYNAWQNRSLYGAVARLDDHERGLDRGAFFGSIQETLSHLMWGDALWMSRFSGSAPPPCSQAESRAWFTEFEPMRAAREALDETIVTFADAMRPESLEGELSWYSHSRRANATRPRWIAIAHFFNHQTHHRGQVHALLTAARPDFRESLEPTDFVALRL